MAVPRKEPDLDAILRAFVYLYSESRRVTRAVADQYGLTGSQLLVVKILEEGQGTSLSELSERLRAKNSTVTGIVDRMERDGIVTRTRSETDRRVVHLGLTGKGKKLAQTAQIDPMHLFRALLQDLDGKDAADLERIMTKLARRVRELFDAGSLPGETNETRDLPPPGVTRLIQGARGKTT
jgi:DNA-binding MarR family transcriptional regulator